MKYEYEDIFYTNNLICYIENIIYHKIHKYVCSSCKERCSFDNMSRYRLHRKMKKHRRLTTDETEFVNRKLRLDITEHMFNQIVNEKYVDFKNKTIISSDFLRQVIKYYIYDE